MWGYESIWENGRKAEKEQEFVDSILEKYIYIDLIIERRDLILNLKMTK